jgi:hypothetical protein
MFIIVTDAMEAAMTRDLDALRDSLPENERELFDAERHVHRQEIINFFGEHGYYPSIGGVSKSPTTANSEAELQRVAEAIRNAPNGIDGDNIAVLLDQCEQVSMNSETREQADALINKICSSAAQAAIKAMGGERGWIDISTAPKMVAIINELTDKLDIARKALKEIATGKNEIGEKVDFFEEIAQEALKLTDIGE